MEHNPNIAGIPFHFSFYFFSFFGLRHDIVDGDACSFLSTSVFGWGMELLNRSRASEGKKMVRRYRIICHSIASFRSTGVSNYGILRSITRYR